MKMKRIFASFLLAIFGLMAGLQVPSLAARVTMTAQSPPTILAGSPAADALDIAFTAADATNKQEVVLTGNEILVFWNTHASTAYTVTINTVADSLGRTGDVTAYSLAAGEIGWYGPIPTGGYAQSNGKLYFEANNASVKFAVLKIRGQVQYK